MRSDEPPQRTDAEARRQRAVARQSWPARRTSLGDSDLESEDIAALLARTTAAERMAMVTELTRQAWALAGKSPPEFERRDMPVRILHLEDL